MRNYLLSTAEAIKKRSIYFWKIDGKKITETPAAPIEHVSHGLRLLTFAPDGKTIILGGVHDFQVWDLERRSRNWPGLWNRLQPAQSIRRTAKRCMPPMHPPTKIPG